MIYHRIHTTTSGICFATRHPHPVVRVLAIGNFDGVHRGHQHLLQQLTALATAEKINATVLSFTPHPLAFFARHSPRAAPLPLQTLSNKLHSLACYQVNEVLLQRFDARFAQMCAEDFIADCLVAQWRARYVVVGENFRFGAERKGDITLLRARAQRYGYQVIAVPLLEQDDSKISSGRVRLALQNGDVHTTAQLLGRLYAISGRVLHGKKLGRTLGYPTINLHLPHNAQQEFLLQGIYAVLVYGLSAHGDNSPIYGVASCGRRPTVEANGVPLLEVFLLDFNHNVYGKRVKVVFLHYLRGEEKFDSLPALQQQMAQDVTNAQAYFAQTDISQLAA